MAKIAKKEAHKACIHHVAEFESAEKLNEDLANAMPRPNFEPHGSLAAHNKPDGSLLAPPGESDDSGSINIAKTPVPKGTRINPNTKVNQLATIMEDSRDENLSNIPFSELAKRAHGPKRIILEETDSDGHAPPFKNWKWKLKCEYSPENEDEGRQVQDDEENRNLPLPSKKSRVEEREVENPRASKKKKISICEAIAAIQKGMNTMADSGQASEKWGDFRVAMVEGGILSKDVKSSSDKQFGDDPQWSK